MEREFGARVGYAEPTPTRAPSIYVHSKVLHRLFRDVLRLRDRRIPLLGDATPACRASSTSSKGSAAATARTVARRLATNCASTRSASNSQSTSTISSCGSVIVASFGRYETTFKAKYGDRKFPFYRLTICALDDFNILNWDRGVIADVERHPHRRSRLGGSS